MNLLIKIYNLFMQMPPLPIEELFGEVAANPAPIEAKEEWEQVPPELMEGQQYHRAGTGFGNFNEEEH